MALGAAMLLGIVSFIVILLVAIPLGGIGVIAVITGKTAGLTWNAYTITLAVIAGAFLILVILYALALISVPLIVFFPAYSIHFFASRYRPLDARILRRRFRRFHSYLRLHLSRLHHRPNHHRYRRSSIPALRNSE